MATKDFAAWLTSKTDRELVKFQATLSKLARAGKTSPFGRNALDDVKAELGRRNH